MLTVTDRGEGGGGVKFAKILLTSYVNAPLVKTKICNRSRFQININSEYLLKC